MSGRIKATEMIDFESFIIHNYYGLFEEWELDYSEFMDLDCWIYDQHFDLIRKFHSLSKDDIKW